MLILTDFSVLSILTYIYIYIYTLRWDKRDGSEGQLSAQFGCLRNCARIDGIGEKQKGLISMGLGLRSAK